MIYLDNAATTGQKPMTVIKAVENAMKFYSANPGRSGHALSIKAAESVYRARQKIAEFFGASRPENVIFTLNCTQSINYVLKGILSRGDRVVTSDLEHNAVMRPLAKIGADAVFSKVSDNDIETVEEFKKNITKLTKLVICTAASNVTGKILPIEKIGQICRERGVPFAVDGAQLCGLKRINVKEMNIDYLCIAPHKGLYAPMGIGVLICEKELENTLIEGGTGTESANFEQPDELPERLESGTLPVPLIAGVLAGIDFLLSKNPEKIYRHELSLCKRLYEGLARNGKTVIYSPLPDEGYSPVVSFNVMGSDSFKTAAYLNDKGIAVRGGLHCAPSAHKKLKTLRGGTVRVSPGFFNSQKDIEYLIKVINNY